MSSSRTLAVVLVLLGSTLGVATGEEDAEQTPEWAQDLNLFVFGGAPSGDIELRLNGEFVAEIIESVPPTIEVNDLLKPGLNELEIKYRPAESPQQAKTPLQISIAKFEQVSTFQSRIGTPLVKVSIPPAPLGEACTETFRFWAGPPAEEPVALKKQYWIFVDGRPLEQRVMLSLNGTPIYSANSGTQFFEITQHVKKGKNTVTFEGTPTCFVPQSGRDDPFRMGIVIGELVHDTVKMHGAPLTMIEVSQNRSKPINRKQSFRGY